MIRFAITLFLTLVVIGFSGLFILKTPDGSPWLSIEMLIPNTPSVVAELQELTEVELPKIAESYLHAEVAVGNHQDIYRWQDIHGQWQYSDSMPGDQQQVMTMSFNGALNGDLAVHPVPARSANKHSNSDDAVAAPTAFSAERIATLINKARHLQQLMENREKIETD